MIISEKTDKGLVRENNQDACRSGFFPDGCCWAIVCDGMGGVSGGQIASRIACDAIEHSIIKGYRPKMKWNLIKELLLSALLNANIEVFETGREDMALKGMGTTAVVMIISGGYAIIAHVGDSRAYLIRSGEIRALTKDHSIVQYMIDTGRITPEEALTHPDRNIITRAVGVDAMVDSEIDLEEIKTGDRIVLCTDGLTNSVTDETILKVTESTDINFVAEKLIEAANSGGGRDNITAVVIEC